MAKSTPLFAAAQQGIFVVFCASVRQKHSSLLSTLVFQHAHSWTPFCVFLCVCFFFIRDQERCCFPKVFLRVACKQVKDVICCCPTLFSCVLHKSRSRTLFVFFQHDVLACRTLVGQEGLCLGFSNTAHKKVKDAVCFLSKFYLQTKF